MLLSRSAALVGPSLVVGAALAILARRWLEPMPAWAHLIEQRLDAQANALDQQRSMLESLGSVVSHALAGRSAANSGPSCVSGDELREALTGSRLEPKNAPNPAAAASAALAEQAGTHALDEVVRLVERATDSGGMWGEKDAAEFRSLIGLMTPAQRDQAMSKVIVALNQGHLTLAAQRPF